MADTQFLTALERDLIEEFGSLYEGYGFPRVMGLIVGLLLTQEDPISLDDMAVLLARSKGPISSAVRDLVTRNLIRKVDGPSKRRDYYVAHPDIFLNNFRFNMTVVRKNRRTAEQFRSEASDASPVLRQRLDTMLAFYAKMEAFYAAFERAWESRSDDTDPSLSL